MFGFIKHQGLFVNKTLQHFRSGTLGDDFIDGKYKAIAATKD